MFQYKINRFFLFLALFVSPAVVTAQATFATTADPRFSPDGKQFVFSSVVHQASNTSGVLAKKLSAGIAVMNVDGTGFRVVTQNAPGIGDTEPSFSPDGKKIVFRRSNLTGTVEQGDIYVINSDGSGLKQLSSNKAGELRPEFMVDGKSVVFVRQYFAGTLNPYSSELISINLQDGKEQVLITKEFRVTQVIPVTTGKGGLLIACAEIDQNGKPLPKGDMLAVVSPAGEFNARTFMKLPSQGQNRPEIRRVIALFAPSNIAFYVYGNDGGGWDAEDITYKITPKEIKKLPEFSSFRDANLSPDGKQAVFGYGDIRDPNAGQKVYLREIIGDAFGQQISVGAKK